MTRNGSRYRSAGRGGDYAPGGGRQGMASISTYPAILRGLLAGGVMVGSLLTSTPAMAGPPDPSNKTTEPADDPVAPLAEVVAKRLRQDPVYVSDNVAALAPPDVVAKVRIPLRRMPVPTFLVVLTQQVRNSGREDLLLDEVHSRVGRDGVYVIAYGIRHMYGEPLDISSGGIGLDARQYGGV